MQQGLNLDQGSVKRKEIDNLHINILCNDTVSCPALLAVCRRMLVNDELL